MPPVDIRACLLQVIAEQEPKDQIDAPLESSAVLGAAHLRLGGRRDPGFEKAILTVFYDLFRIGLVAWGHNLPNPNPPKFHITDRGKRSLETLSRDPTNPDGYMNYLGKVGRLNPITDSYLREGVACFVQDLPKAAAVMVGGASESMALELRDAIVRRLQGLGRPLPKGFDDWRIKVVLDSIFSFFNQHEKQMPRDLWDAFSAYWTSFVQQIRISRNEAGHPTNVDPVTFDTVHASLLIFPELARLTFRLREWVETEL